MNRDQFRESLESPEPPRELSPLLLALWYDARGDWDRAHRIAQDIDTREGARLHAYLHREEGDESNARYWYARAGSPPVTSTLAAEWEQLLSDFSA